MQVPGPVIFFFRRATWSGHRIMESPGMYFIRSLQPKGEFPLRLSSSATTEVGPPYNCVPPLVAELDSLRGIPLVATLPQRHKSPGRKFPAGSLKDKGERGRQHEQPPSLQLVTQHDPNKRPIKRYESKRVGTIPKEIV